MKVLTGLGASGSKCEKGQNFDIFPKVSCFIVEIEKRLIFVIFSGALNEKGPLSWQLMVCFAQTCGS